MQKERLLEELVSMGIRDDKVLSAVRRVPRENFVLPFTRAEAYRNIPLPIDEGQTISQPYVVAYMTEALQLDEGDRVLEIGTGSGYQAAVLAKLAARVYTMEIVETLGTAARKKLEAGGYTNVEVRIGDGYEGWPEEAPFDAIIITAAPPAIPPPLLGQLADGGRMVAPVGEHRQELVLIKRRADELTEERLIPVAFVPMTGEAQNR